MFPLYLSTNAVFDGNDNLLTTDAVGSLNAPADVV